MTCGVGFWTTPWLTWCGLNKYPELNLKESNWNDTHTHTHTETYTHLPLRHWHTRVVVTDTHKHIDRVLYTFMTSYLPRAYRLSILIDKQVLFINCWLIRLSVDNVLLISTRRLSILIDKTIPLSIGVSTALDSLEFSFAMICVWSITLPVSIDMLQIHPYAQLAHWAVVTLTTVEDRCEKDHPPHEVSLMWFFEFVYFRKEK